MDTTVVHSASKQQIQGMRSVIVEAVDLFAKNRATAIAQCFNPTVKDVDWQLSLSDAVTLKECSTLKGCKEDDVIFFFRMSETNSTDPRVFLAAIMCTPSPTKESLHYVFRFWDSMPPGWRGSDSANAKCNNADAPILAGYLSNCLDRAAANQMPTLEESRMELISEESNT
jgi:hypothetical protein